MRRIAAFVVAFLQHGLLFMNCYCYLICMFWRILVAFMFFFYIFYVCFSVVDHFAEFICDLEQFLCGIFTVYENCTVVSMPLFGLFLGFLEKEDRS